MYGFRPGRNSRHPGDRPPMWAPLGRAGGLALAIAVVAGVVIALLILATRPAEASRGVVAAGACVELSVSTSAEASVPIEALAPKEDASLVAWGSFLTVEVDNEVTLRSYEGVGESTPQHYAFLVTEGEFDRPGETLGPRLRLRQALQVLQDLLA